MPEAATLTAPMADTLDPATEAQPTPAVRRLTNARRGLDKDSFLLVVAVDDAALCATVQQASQTAQAELQRVVETFADNPLWQRLQTLRAKAAEFSATIAQAEVDAETSLAAARQAVGQGEPPEPHEVANTEALATAARFRNRRAALEEIWPSEHEKAATACRV